jgi:hypothetical protein
MLLEEMAVTLPMTTVRGETLLEEMAVTLPMRVRSEIAGRDGCYFTND